MFLYSYMDMYSSNIITGTSGNHNLFNLFDYLHSHASTCISLSVQDKHKNSEQYTYVHVFIITTICTYAISSQQVQVNNLFNATIHISEQLLFTNWKLSPFSDEAKLDNSDIMKYMYFFTKLVSLGYTAKRGSWNSSQVPLLSVQVYTMTITHIFSMANQQSNSVKRIQCLTDYDCEQTNCTGYRHMLYLRNRKRFPWLHSLI